MNFTRRGLDDVITRRPERKFCAVFCDPNSVVVPDKVTPYVRRGLGTGLDPYKVSDPLTWLTSVLMVTSFSSGQECTCLQIPKDYWSTFRI
ncbi:Hypp5618 [Branchiostoma lanceolatum]|uniref:Hypp5618 protein n=1 Tax=Branchiostoma lanceolatum TaxID=7740 RepID=A0A8J9W361_BRALA|nr:Hypp5618 [Branchiostoma lanceolatum]